MEKKTRVTNFKKVLESFQRRLKYKKGVNKT